MQQSKNFCGLTVSDYKNLVASMGCIICGGPAELHHIRDGMGAGQRNNDWNILPLCAPHHRTGGYGIAFHAGKVIWQKLNGSEHELQRILNDAIKKAVGYKSSTDYQ